MAEATRLGSAEEGRDIATKSTGEAWPLRVASAGPGAEERPRPKQGGCKADATRQGTAGEGRDIATEGTEKA